MRAALAGLLLASLAVSTAAARPLSDPEARAAYCGGVLQAKADEITRLGAPPEPELREAWTRIRRATLEARMRIASTLMPQAADLDRTELSALMELGAGDNETAHAVLAHCVTAGADEAGCLAAAMKNAGVRRVRDCTLSAGLGP